MCERNGKILTLNCLKLSFILYPILTFFGGVTNVLHSTLFSDILDPRFFPYSVTSVPHKHNTRTHSYINSYFTSRYHVAEINGRVRTCVGSTHTYMLTHTREQYERLSSRMWGRVPWYTDSKLSEKPNPTLFNVDVPICQAKWHHIPSKRYLSLSLII